MGAVCVRIDKDLVNEARNVVKLNLCLFMAKSFWVIGGDCR